MHQVSPLRNSPIIDERRRYPRHKPTSIIYVDLGPGNGGILVNLSAGGVSLQAAAKLSAETELALNFRLQGIEPAIETIGFVAWLDPTHKEAGISFKDLPSNTEQQIAQWIASHEQPARTAQTEIKPHLRPPETAEPLRLPIQASIPVMFPSEQPANAEPSFVPRILAESLSDSPTPNDFETALDAKPSPAAVSPMLRFPTHTQEKFESPVDAPARHYELHVEPQSLSVGGSEILPRDCVLPDSISLPGEIVAEEHLAPPDSSALDLRRRRKFAIGTAAGMMGILALIVVATSVNKTPVPDSAAQTIRSNSQPVSVAPEKKPPETKRAAPARRADKTAPSSTVSTGDDPVPMVRVAVAPVQQDTGFMATLRTLLGLDVSNTIDPAAAALPVWTVQHSGFYYCAQSPDFRTLQPGVTMTQGQALQSGYQPKLGSYCQ